MPKADVPTIVVQFNLLNQTAPIGPTSIFTPTTAGVFRISVYLDYSPGVKPADGQNAISLQLAWNDDFGAESASPSFTIEALNTSGNFGARAFTAYLFLIANQPLAVTVTPDPTLPTTYNLRVTVEDMN